MKSFLYSVCIVCMVAGVTFYWHQGLTAQGKRVPSEMSHVDKDTAATKKEHVPSVEASPPDENGCGCCKTAREKVRQKRKELEMWAREMIDTHGYDEGMKRVTAKSPTLAKRIQQLLEKEKSGSTSVSSHVTQ